MWSIGKNVTYEDKGKNSAYIWALVGQDAVPVLVILSPTCANKNIVEIV